MTNMSWGQEEFGHAQLGNELRTRRAVAIANGCAEQPAGKITAVFSSAASREGTFRFVENDAIEVAKLKRAPTIAAARRCSTAALAYVPIDKTSVYVTDGTGNKRLGMVGTSQCRAHGFHVMTALAVTDDGVPQGIAHQSYWTRTRKAKTSKRDNEKIPTSEKETQEWIDAMNSVAETFAAHAPATTIWFQLDREGDATAILAAAVAAKHCVTVRASWDRRIKSDGDQRAYLWSRLTAQPVLGRYAIDLPSTTRRKARRAVMEVRAIEGLVLETPKPRSRSRRQMIPINVVFARELPSTEDDDAIEWMLLTTRKATTFEQACEVLHGYTQRWRIEEFHKVWKSGACCVEDSQLRDVDNLIRWAVILASVAVRIVRMSYAARALPNRPACAEFNAIEITVIAKLAKPKHVPATPTVADVVLWLATIGGYTGPSSGGPPGPIVLSRGLTRIQAAVQLLTEVTAGT